MDKIIKKILTTIENNHFEAYLVGGFVRDYLLGIKTKDIDICTNALPKDLHKMFPNNKNSNQYGGFNMQIKGYNIDITTYREEYKYLDRKPTEVVYINDLKIDIQRRDFTINSICMDKNEKVIDLVNGVNDLNNRVIKMHGDIHKKIQEDPLRILRAIRFSCILDFDIDPDLLKEIQNNYKLVKNLSFYRLKSELNKILLHKNYLKGLSLLKDLHILEELEISYDEISYVHDICGMWAQLNFSSNYTFTKQEFRNIINIKQIIKDGISNKIIYKYGLYTSLVAGDILNINKNTINKMYKKLPIKNRQDIAIKVGEVIDLLNIDVTKLNKIYEDLEEKILDGIIINNNKIIKKYLVINYS